MVDSKNVRLKVVGSHNIHCHGCENSVKFALSNLPGVTEVQVSYETQEIDVALYFGGAQLEDIRAELDMMGYEVEEA